MKTTTPTWIASRPHSESRYVPGAAPGADAPLGTALSVCAPIETWHQYRFSCVSIMQHRPLKESIFRTSHARTSFYTSFKNFEGGSSWNHKSVALTHALIQAYLNTRASALQRSSYRWLDITITLSIDSNSDVIPSNNKNLGTPDHKVVGPQEIWSLRFLTPCAPAPLGPDTEPNQRGHKLLDKFHLADRLGVEHL